MKNYPRGLSEMAVHFDDSEATTWPVRPDSAAARIDELLSTAGLEILDAIYKQPGVSRAARQELARNIAGIMGRTRVKVAREVEGSI